MVSPALIAGVPVVVVIAKVLGLYDRDELVVRKSTLDEAPKVFQLATLFTLVVSIGQARLQLGELGGDQVLALWVVLFRPPRQPGQRASRREAHHGARALPADRGLKERNRIRSNPRRARPTSRSWHSCPRTR